MRKSYRNRATTEADVLNALERAMRTARLAGVPVVVAAIRPSNEIRTSSVMARGVGTVEDLAYLASTALYECMRSIPREGREGFSRMVVEFTEEMHHVRDGGPLPAHMDDEELPDTVGLRVYEIPLAFMVETDPEAFIEQHRETHPEIVEAFKMICELDTDGVQHEYLTRRGVSEDTITAMLLAGFIERVREVA